MTSAEYAAQPRAAVPDDERFIHDYLTQNRVGVKQEEDDSDAASVNSDEFDMIVGGSGRSSWIIADQFVPGGRNDQFDIDYARGVAQRAQDGKSKKKRKREEEEDESDDDFEDDDEDVFEELAESAKKRVHRDEFGKKGKFRSAKKRAKR